MDNETNPQNNLSERSGSVVVGLYAWSVAVFFGAILLDVTYANLLRDSLGTSEVTAIFSEVSDCLLGIGFITVLAALGAIVFSWKSPGARNFFISSLIVLFAEFLAPAFLPGAILNTGYWIRIIFNAAASILASIGLYKFYRPG